LDDAAPPSLSDDWRKAPSGRLGVRGCVASIGGFCNRYPLVTDAGCNIRAAEVYGDSDTLTFFSRIELDSLLSLDALVKVFAPAARELQLDWELKDSARKERVLVAVSSLIDIVHKQEIGHLPIEIVGVVSNHETMRHFAEWHSLPYHHLPINEGKEAQELRFSRPDRGDERRTYRARTLHPDPVR
jgi:formyltetrahydrofolate hydrolase